MGNKIQQNTKDIALTPSTRKLMQMREGKGPGMLNEEEIALLRKSKREIIEACRDVRESGIVNDAKGASPARRW